MKTRKITQGVSWLGAVDWDRRLFDSLIPLPDGTTYNAYLVEGSEKTALLDTVDPPMADTLMAQLDTVTKLDFIVSQHSEQDHSGPSRWCLSAFQRPKWLYHQRPKGCSWTPLPYRKKVS